MCFSVSNFKSCKGGLIEEGVYFNGWSVQKSVQKKEAAIETDFDNVN